MIAYTFRLRYNRIEIISPDNLIPIPLLNKVDCTPAVYFVLYGNIYGATSALRHFALILHKYTKVRKL